VVSAYINDIATSVPAHACHGAFLRFARDQFGEHDRRRPAFERMVSRGGIDQRYSVLRPSDRDSGPVDEEGFYTAGSFPSTGERMRRYERHAPGLVAGAVESLEAASDATHLVVTTCTGFSAPGIDFDILRRCGLPGSVERTMVGFMGCYAAINALKLARHIVRSEPEAKVLVVNVELCTLHLQQTDEMEKLLSFYLFGDGCAVSLVSAEPRGLAIDGFRACLAPSSEDHITWSIGDGGFDMTLSGRVPAAIETTLRAERDRLRGDNEGQTDLWAVHPGGRTVLDAVERALDLAPDALDASRRVLRDFGNMSSATVMFVLQRMMAHAKSGERGCAMAFGPGLVAETMRFHAA
jgi:alpha-pyrone synthase